MLQGLLLKGLQFASFEACHQVVIEDRVFPDSIDSDLVERLLLEVNAVAAAKNLRVADALQKPVHKEAAVWACRQARFPEYKRRLYPHGKEDDINRITPAGLQGNLA